MAKILVIADDLSGAAEIAGIGVRFGLAARIDRGMASEIADGITVVDTDTRSASPATAAALLTRLFDRFRDDKFDLIYKKCDSVLRGPLLAEVELLMETFRRPAALLVPQNPSRGRCISGGSYRIDGVPLADTAFAHDPEHPASTSDALTLLGASTKHPTRCVSGGQPLTAGIFIGEATSIDDVRRWTAGIGDNVLPVGSADLFQSLLEARGYVDRHLPPPDHYSGTSLFVCGSASAGARDLITRASDANIPICRMPHGDPQEQWRKVILAALDTAGRAIAIIDKPLDRSPEAPQRLREAIAAVAKDVLDDRAVDNIFLEGGATASAVCRAMDWHHLNVTRELCPGVAEMIPTVRPQTRAVIKPGSYRWPSSVFNLSATPRA